MAEVGEKLAVLGELNDAVAGHGSGEIDVQVAIHADGLQAAGPARDIRLRAPGPENVAVRIELDHFRAEDATFCAGRRGHGAQFVGPGVVSAIDGPDVVVFVDVDVDDLLHAPFVGQALGPKGVDAVNRALLRVRWGNDCSAEAREYESDSKTSGRLIPHTHGGLSCSLFRRDFQLTSAVA